MFIIVHLQMMVDNRVTFIQGSTLTQNLKNHMKSYNHCLPYRLQLVLKNWKDQDFNVKHELYFLYSFFPFLHQKVQNAQWRIKGTVFLLLLPSPPPPQKKPKKLNDALERLICTFELTNY